MGYPIREFRTIALLEAIRKIIPGNRCLPPPVTRALSRRSPGSELSDRAITSSAVSY
jgi:hypothetical protein